MSINTRLESFKRAEHRREAVRQKLIADLHKRLVRLNHEQKAVYKQIEALGGTVPVLTALTIMEQEMVGNHQMVPAIKAVRDRLGISLKEAKGMVDACAALMRPQAAARLGQARERIADALQNAADVDDDGTVLGLGV